MKKEITISQIARESGFSISTVSRVLNHKPDVLPETRSRILEIIEKYDFQVSAYAKGIVQKSSRTIGLVVAHDTDYIFLNQYFSQLLRGIAGVTNRHNYYLLSFYGQNLKDAVDAVIQQRIEGILLVSPTYEQKDAIKTLLSKEIPVIVIGTDPGQTDAITVSTDDYHGTADGMEYLFSCGHKNIAFISGPARVASSRERYRAYADGMKAHGYPILPGMVCEGEHTINSGKVVLEILERYPQTTAIFAGSDFIAVGVINTLQSCGIRVPENVSVIGFDDVPLANQILPKLTTINQQGDYKGELATEMLLRWIEAGEKPQESVVMQPHLVIRSSVFDFTKSK